MDLPSNCEYYSQFFYSCIGFTVGATLGTLVARRELGKEGRVILFVGDGSLQMTAQVTLGETLQIPVEANTRL
jgi:pyruvate decarboxylase